MASRRGGGLGRRLHSLLSQQQQQNGVVSQVRSTTIKRGGGSKESFFSEGKNDPGGLLFNESPPADGVRQWESWEAPWYFAFGAATAILTIGLSAKPDTSLVAWAEREALARRES